MTPRPYKPRRAGKRWLEEAPEYILDVFDNKGKTVDRYTVLFGGSMLEDSLVESRKVYCLGMSSYPTLPWFGFSMWGECDAAWRPSHQRIRWVDLSEHIRDYVIRIATYDPQ